MGTVLGMKGIPDKWAILRPLPIDNTSFTTGGPTIKEIYPNPIDWDDILAATVEVGLLNILHSGGRIEDGMMYIPRRRPTAPPPD